MTAQLILIVLLGMTSFFAGIYAQRDANFRADLRERAARNALGRAVLRGRRL